MKKYMYEGCKEVKREKMINNLIIKKNKLKNKISILKMDVNKCDEIYIYENEIQFIDYLLKYKI